MRVETSRPVSNVPSLESVTRRIAPTESGPPRGTTS
jgi:hypothetical protein